MTQATTPIDPTRRRLLVAVAKAPLLVVAAPLLAGAVAACSPPAARTAPGPRPDSDVKVRWAAAHGEQALLDRYSAAIAAHPSLSVRLTPVRDRHAAHLAALLADGPLPFAGQTGAPTPTVPPTAAGALEALRTAEADHAADCLTGCVAARGPRLAATLASIAACDAAHPTTLAAA